MCEIQGVCPPAPIRWRRNECISQRERILVYRIWKHEEHNFVVWVAPRLVWLFCNVPDPNVRCKCYEEVTMGGNIYVWNFWMNRTIYLGKWKLLGWAGDIAWGRDDVLGPGHFNYSCGEAIQICIYQIGPTCKWCDKYYWLKFGTGKVISHKGISYVP